MLTWNELKQAINELEQYHPEMMNDNITIVVPLGNTKDEYHLLNIVDSFITNSNTPEIYSELDNIMDETTPVLVSTNIL